MKPQTEIEKPKEEKNFGVNMRKQLDKLYLLISNFNSSNLKEYLKNLNNDLNKILTKIDEWQNDNKDFDFLIRCILLIIAMFFVSLLFSCALTLSC